MLARLRHGAAGALHELAVGAPGPVVIKALSDATVRRRDVRAKVEWSDLKAMLARSVMNDLELPGAAGVNGVTVEVELKQEERGSPSYRIGEWSAIVTVTLPVDCLTPGPKA